MKVAITGFGLVSPLGWGKDANALGLLSGQVAVSDIQRFPTAGFRSGRGATVPSHPQGKGCPRKVAHTSWYAWEAGSEALAQAGDLGEDLALVFGGSTAGMHLAEEGFFQRHSEVLDLPNPRALLSTTLASTADELSDRLSLGGTVLSLSSACSGGAHAIAEAADCIEAGRFSCALAGGADSLCRLTLAGFNALGVVSNSVPRPFDAQRDGMVLGEGAAFFVLEDEQRALGRGARVLAWLRGFGAISEGHHLIHPDASGGGAARAMEAALEQAGWEAGEVDYVNVHGTATRQNDAAEAAALEKVFDGRLPPVSSTKSQWGHALGASGAMELAACLLGLKHQVLPVNAGFETPDPDSPLAVVERPGTQASLNKVLSNSLAFGGNDVCLALERGP